MKTSFIQAILLIIFICGSLQAGRHGQPYKAADYRQHERTAIKTAHYLDKFIKIPSIRTLRRYSYKTMIPSNSTKVLGLGLALMVMLPTVAAAIPDEHAMVWAKNYYGGVHFKHGYERDSSYGPCQKLPNNSSLCCDIGEDYVATCCIYPNKTETDRIAACCCPSFPRPPCDCWPKAYCISYGIEGVLGDQALYLPLNLTGAYKDAEKQCEISYRIARDAAVLQRITTAESCGKVTFRYSNGTEGICHLGYEEPEVIQDLSDIVQRVLTKFSFISLIPPHVDIFSSLCDSEIQNLMKHLSLAKVRHQPDGKSRLQIFVPPLELSSDEEVASVIGHEAHHIKQADGVRWGIRYNEKNNQEAEADLASILATDSPCVAVYLRRHVNDLSFLSFPLITRENLHALLKEQEGDEHPADANRIAFVLTMYEHHKRAMAYLRGALEHADKGVPVEKTNLFIADACTHNVAYASGVLAGLGVTGWALYKRLTMHK